MMRRTRAVPWVLLVVVLLVIVAIGGSGRREGPPLDPRSDAPHGTSALVALLERAGASVTLGDAVPSSAASDVVLVLRQPAGDEGPAQLEGFARRGGVVVVADVAVSSFGFAAAASASGTLSQGSCDMRALRDAGTLEVSGDFAGVFSVEAGDRACFTNAGRTQAYVVARPVGDGWVIAIGGPGALVNESLGAADNAILAVALLAPSPATRVTVLDPGAAIGTGDRDLIEVVAPGVKRALVQAVIAFVVYALYRARRLGRLVREPQPTQIAGSELTVAVGELLQQTRAPAAAAAILRSDLRRTLRDRLGIGVDVPPDVAAAEIARRTGLAPERAHTALADEPVNSDAELVAAARTIESVRQEVLG